MQPQQKTSSPAHPCRTVTAEEIAHYREFGWVKLPGFVSPDIVQLLLKTAKERMGEDGDSNPGYGYDQSYFNAEQGQGLSNEPVRELIRHVGRNARLMMRRTGVGVRYFQDFFAPKLPSQKKTRRWGNGPTSFHQDYISFSVDRSEGMTFWLALEDYGPEWGTMSFVNGSHRFGVYGNYRTYPEGKDLLDIYPELGEMEMSEPMTYAAGDVTVHSHLTVHGAGANLKDRPRWAYLMLAQPADACWTGAPAEAYETTNMTVHQQLDDERFPIIA
jgi:hypothetical protein